MGTQPDFLDKGGLGESRQIISRFWGFDGFAAISALVSPYANHYYRSPWFVNTLNTTGRMYYLERHYE